ncbi:hypothetical protein BDV41DRAFT_517079 [Aspergillus transmontanensis]|uniref:Secreted protein n=1 Tax=Aspergillus transmontanensis TaxID=1034304 RepID=A0A5N6WHV4_9EURO|nr:hypothetical protein BDV41DRAFT_517079 [Aspergillus transmontanensis]
MCTILLVFWIYFSTRLGQGPIRFGCIGTRYQVIRYKLSTSGTSVNAGRDVVCFSSRYKTALQMDDSGLLQYRST